MNIEHHSAACPKCGADEIVGVCELEGKRCPFYKNGTFVADPKSYRIS